MPDTDKRRSLNEKERSLYAPFSGVGGIVYDKDAVYIDMGPNQPKPQNTQVSKPAQTAEYTGERTSPNRRIHR